MKSQWIISFLLTGALATFANAQENGGVQKRGGPNRKLRAAKLGRRRKRCCPTTSTRRSRMQGPTQTG